MHTLDALQVFARHTSGNVQQVIQGAIPVVETHLQQAQALMKELEGEPRTAALPRSE
jgi:hypothetical protein